MDKLDAFVFKKVEASTRECYTCLSNSTSVFSETSGLQTRVCVQDPPSAGTVHVMFALARLIRDETEGEPDQQAVDDLLAAGALPTLLRILAGPDMVFAFDIMQRISCAPRGGAAIADTCCASLLVAALGSESCKPSEGDMDGTATAECCSQILAIIGNIVDGRPGQGQAFLAAGIAHELASVFTSPQSDAELTIAMELVEKLTRHTPGACDALMVEGVLRKIHDLATGPPEPTCPRPAFDLPPGEGVPPETATKADLDAAAVEANALLCRVAAYCGGVLEIVCVDEEPARYTSAGPREAEGAAPRPKARGGRPSRRVCSMCGTFSEKQLHSCSKCRRARYCGRDCQKAHWPLHKMECCG
jgi:hypothetical protein